VKANKANKPSRSPLTPYENWLSVRGLGRVFPTAAKASQISYHIASEVERVTWS